VTVTTALKLGQLAGALMLAAGVTACTLRSSSMALWFIAGGLVYGGCRIAAWLRSKQP
jgi:hypothetical protein